jgi:hypothetical protein
MAYAPWIGNLSVRGTPGNYGTVKLFVDEDAHSEVALPVSVEIAAPGLSSDDFDVELFTNQTRRDFVKPFEALAQSGDPARPTGCRRRCKRKAARSQISSTPRRSPPTSAARTGSRRAIGKKEATAGIGTTISRPAPVRPHSAIARLS